MAHTEPRKEKKHRPEINEEYKSQVQSEVVPCEETIELVANKCKGVEINI